jgi:hypothetical protein
MNSHLDTFTLALTAVVTVLAFVAVVVNIWSAYEGAPEAFVTRWCIAALAFVTSVAYLVLLLSEVDPQGWSTVMRGVALVTWPVVWMLPAFASVRTRRNAEKRARSFE